MEQDRLLDPRGPAGERQRRGSRQRNGEAHWASFADAGQRLEHRDVDPPTPAQLQANLFADIEPVVIGPGGQLYLTDGHHTFTALLDSI